MTWLWIVAGAATLASLARDRARTGAALRSALRVFGGLLPAIATMMLAVGLLLAVLPPTAVARLIGPASGVAGIATALVTGAVVMLPSFVAFPLAGSLLKAGAGYPQVAAFVSTVMAVGVVTLPLEARVLGWRAAALRNVFALLTSVLFSLAVLAVMG